MVEPSRLAETVTPSTFWPDDEIPPERMWSAAEAPDAMTRLAALASKIVRTWFIRRTPFLVPFERTLSGSSSSRGRFTHRRPDVPPAPPLQPPERSAHRR